MTPEALRDKRFWLSSLAGQDGRITIYQRPIPGHLYTVGADFAYGLQQGDDDAACVFDKTAQEKTGIATQVAEVQGKWGERFDVILYQLLMYYNGAFLLGERQVGLFTLRRLWDVFGYKFMYRQRSESKATRTQQANAELGWHRGANDLTLKESRLAVANGTVEIRSPALWSQLNRMQWVGRTESSSDERDPDEKLKVKLRGGKSPDLAIAFMYGLRALREVYHYEDEKPAFAPGSYGDIFKLQEKLPGVFGPKPNTSRGWLPDTMIQP